MIIGLYFGSFNPVHIGHLAIANYFVEYTDINQLWFIISPHNPLKKKSTLLHDFDRYDLLKLAIDGDERFSISDIEFNLPQPSYTLNTLTYLNEQYPKYDFILIMGADNLKTFHKWKNFENILKNYKIYVYPRHGFNENIEHYKKYVKVVDAPQIEVSSQFIRNAIKNNIDIKYFLPNKVYNYIKEKKFYI